MMNDFTSKAAQLFDVCEIRTFRYQELVDNIDGCLEYCRKYVDENHEEPCTDKQIEELRGYMQEFMLDVQSDLELSAIEILKNTPYEDLPLIINMNNSKRFQECLSKRFRNEPIPTELEGRFS
jgi:hypothetical protein